jgi:hypothetical protein
MSGGKGTIFDGQLLALILNGTSISNIADNAASSPLTTLYLSLHTTDPGAGGVQNSNEATYTGYGRQGVSRNSSGFTVSGASATLTSTVSFGTPTGGAGQVLAWFALGTLVTGSGEILYRGPITPSITVVNGVPPQLTTGTTITEG